MNIKSVAFIQGWLLFQLTHVAEETIIQGNMVNEEKSDTKM